MGEVISIGAARKKMSATVQEAWDAYLAARSKAEASTDVADGIAAGKAWARFLSLFTRGAA